MKEEEKEEGGKSGAFLDKLNNCPRLAARLLGYTVGVCAACGRGGSSQARLAQPDISTWIKQAFPQISGVGPRGKSGVREGCHRHRLSSVARLSTVIFSDSCEETLPARLFP